MDKGSYGARHQLAIEAIEQSARALGERFGVQAPSLAVQAHDPQIRDLFRLEAVAGLLSALERATEPKPRKKRANGEEQGAQAEGQRNGAVCEEPDDKAAQEIKE
jgi:hypothetical protein